MSDLVQHLREAAIKSREWPAGDNDLLIVLELTPYGVQTEGTCRDGARLARYRHVTSWEGLDQARENALLAAMDHVAARLTMETTNGA